MCYEQRRIICLCPSESVVFIIIYSFVETTFASIELTFGFRSNEPQSKQPSIELTFGFDRNNLRSN